MSVIEIKNRQEFDELKKKGLVCVDFWAPWCGPCMSFAPIFSEAAEKMPEVKFCKINVDECEDLAGEYSVRTIPTIALLKDGKVVNQHSGRLTTEDLMEFCKPIDI